MKNFTTSTIILLLTLLTVSAYSLPKLNSLSTSTATIYLDFDGQTVVSNVWNNGLPIVCAAPTLTDAQITEIFNRVSEDYRPFDINITTDEAKFLAAPLAQRIRIIITPSSSWKTGVGGVSYIGSFIWGDDTPGFVFSDKLGPNNAKYISECCSHESGHTLGLSHQSTFDTNCNLVETYSTGAGSGETGWAPIMGNSYYQNMTGWNNGPTPYGCTLVQDNLDIITTTNGFSYRADDYVETMGESTFTPSATSFSLNALIATNIDKDAFRFAFPQASSFHFEANPYNLGAGNTGSNLDIKVMLYDGTQLIRTYDPSASLSVTIDTNLRAGTYYFVVDGTGNNYANNYGSIGSYTVTGFKSALAIHDVVLSGNMVNNQHRLTWSMSADEPIQSQIIEVSADGTKFNTLTTEDATMRNMSYSPSDKRTKYYRLKVISESNQIVYSNTLVLRGSVQAGLFTVTTLVTTQLHIQASETYQYRLLDPNGRLLQAGKGNQGSNQIDLMNRPSGLYIIQFFSSNNQQQTDKQFNV